MSDKKLTRSSDKVIAGVCGGLANYFGWDVTMVRILYLAISIFSAAFPGTIVYIVLWIVMPQE
jgi:phage shock protein PspC (stress-responsive transcriptional regulator)